MTESLSFWRPASEICPDEPALEIPLQPEVMLEAVGCLAGPSADALLDVLTLS